MSIRLANEVIREAANLYAAGTGPDDHYDFESVIWRRWPATSGGVGHAHAKTRTAVRKLIADIYELPYRIDALAKAGV